uniref:P-type ATPase N-terminal domain-containing protein n=1 Tax=Plectus sambesii TaxID=2011161 RepID=A0A914WNS1_9BILA
MYRRYSDDSDDLDLLPLIGGGMDEQTDRDLLMHNRRRRQSAPVRCYHALTACISGCFSSVFSLCSRRKELHARTIRLGHGPVLGKYPPNVVRNQKYNVFTFVPLVLFQQFKFFLNLYFLIMALSQFIPQIQIGAPITYWGPLGFVLTITLIREALDDFVRFLRDREMNSQKYERLTPHGYEKICSSQITVGDMIVIHKDQRVPADVVLLRTTEKQGACFVRTDQLDGETDWKLRIAVPHTQRLQSDTVCTLTKNEMVFKKMHLGTVAFGADSFEEVAKNVRSAYADGGKVPKHSLAFKVQQAVEAIALCHNVTPLYDDDAAEADQQRAQSQISYQAASPDEVALVSWSESVGLALVHRDLSGMRLQTPTGESKSYQILQLFPFTSETKRMGIILQVRSVKTSKTLLISVLILKKL